MVISWLRALGWNLIRDFAVAYGACIIAVIWAAIWTALGFFYLRQWRRGKK